MATVTIPDASRTITDPEAIAEFLRPYGIRYESWDVDGRISADAVPEEILSAYAPEVERLKAEGGYVTADVISVNPQTPNLEAMLDRFRKEHTHDEDEVRFTVKGQGVFHIHPDGGPVFAIQVTAGDLINVPRGTRHWFDLCQDKTIRCIRLFQDASGWTPHYVDGSTLHNQYLPVCLGPSFVSADRSAQPRSGWVSP
jgi:1,2-dihydroxy-3-keto-5-methylthiopentene dioxygenase